MQRRQSRGSVAIPVEITELCQVPHLPSSLMAQLMPAFANLMKCEACRNLDFCTTGGKLTFAKVANRPSGSNESRHSFDLALGSFPALPQGRSQPRAVVRIEYYELKAVSVFGRDRAAKPFPTGRCSLRIPDYPA